MLYEVITVRHHPTRPSTVAVLRYNDTNGLRALGIRVHPYWPDREIELRETADPFPGDTFATPPP